MTRPLLTLFLAVSLLTSLSACGGSSSTTVATGDDEGEWGEWEDEEDIDGEATHVTTGDAREMLGMDGPETPWADMSHEEKEFYMIGKFHPVMKQIFAEYDENRWGHERYECENCHGRDMRERNYEMPPPDSYPVPEYGSEAWQRMETGFGETVAFMKDEVTPAMGSLLGWEEPRCTACHRSAD